MLLRVIGLRLFLSIVGLMIVRSLAAQTDTILIETPLQVSEHAVHIDKVVDVTGRNICGEFYGLKADAPSVVKFKSGLAQSALNALKEESLVGEERS